jgi:hypothetical protein
MAPVPVFAGQADDGYPYPFAGYRVLPGTTACAAALTDDERVAQARPVVAFLRSLHGVPVAAETARSGPRNEIGRSDLPLRLQHTVARARFLALSYGVILLGYGRAIGEQSLVRAGRAALALAGNQYAGA